MSEFDDYQRAKEEARQRRDMELEDLWEDIRAWERKRRAEIEAYERNESNPEWGTFG